MEKPKEFVWDPKFLGPAIFDIPNQKPWWENATPARFDPLKDGPIRFLKK